MIQEELRHMMAAFPWDLCRRLYSPASVPSVQLRGLSFDWEYLLLSAFVDAKTIIIEWLLFNRTFGHDPH
eukprot:CAMPEP_0173210364 /NCGR_PEP_ID=MMETSP1141-20130122/23619_1 /TAXON_ID=483371 /ORGANISM="non described non described, Strain CCMP2298" /LENGTH=69 /DNA_ID=CAMNT_0014137095 /DNA_START=32 /DNA_END=238 /DNA_ORIENTATION=+